MIRDVAVRLWQESWVRWLVVCVGVALLAYAVLTTTGIGARGSDPVWSRIQRERVLRVGMDASYPPFEVIGEGGAFEGFDVDLAGMMAEAWDVDLQLVNVHFDGLYDALATGKFDLIISAVPYDRTMTRDVLYSDPYFRCGQVVLARQSEGNIASVSDLAGRTVLVELGSGAHSLMRRLTVEKGLTVTLRTAREPDEITAAMNDATVDAVVCDRVQALGYLRQSPDWYEVGDPLTDESYVMAADREASDLIAEINTLLAGWQQDGALGRLQDVWFL